jgi:hypothetical protein
MPPKPDLAPLPEDQADTRALEALLASQPLEANAQLTERILAKAQASQATVLRFPGPWLTASIGLAAALLLMLSLSLFQQGPAEVVTTATATPQTDQPSEVAQLAQALSGLETLMLEAASEDELLALADTQTPDAFDLWLN